MQASPGIFVEIAALIVVAIIVLAFFGAAALWVRLTRPKAWAERGWRANRGSRPAAEE